MPMKIPGLECECQNRPVDLSLEPAYITWLKRISEPVEAGEAVLEGEVQKRIISIPSPCSGILSEIIVEEGWSAAADEVLGYIEDGRS